MNAAALPASTQTIRKIFSDSIAAKRTFLREHGARIAPVADLIVARFSEGSKLLLFGNGEWLYGPTAEVLTEQTIERLYGLRVKELAWAGGRTFVADV